MNNICGKEIPEQDSHSCSGCCFRYMDRSEICSMPLSVTKCNGTILIRILSRDIFKL